MIEEFEELYKLITRYASFKGMGWWVIDYKNDPEHFYCNDEMKRMFSLDPSQKRFSIAKSCPIAGEYNKHIEKADKEAAAKIFADYQALLDNKSDTYENSFPYLNEKMEEKYFNSQAHVLKRDASGHVELIHGIIHDVTREKELEKLVEIEKNRYKNLSETDPLTQLLNRRKFEELFSHQFEAANRLGQKLGVVMLDIDHFKRFNDTAGHQKGDETLQKVAECIQRVFSRQNDLCARYGGEEFVISIFCDSAEILAQKLKELKEALKELRLAHPDSPVNSYVTLSMGGCLYDPLHSQEFSKERLIRRADENLYHAKRSGRNKIVICSL